MDYNYTAYYKTDEERINAIVKDILKEYPNLGNLAIDAAKLESPFGMGHEDEAQFSDYENCINRLIDIVIVTEGKPEFQKEYEKACKDLLTSYRDWRTNFTYANPEEQPVYLVMQRFNEHLQNKEVPFMTVNQASAELIKLRKEKDMKEKADWLRSDFPKLGAIADEVIKLEDESGIWIRWVENDIIRLVTIVKLTEDREDSKEIYSEALKRLNNKYSEWTQNEIKGNISEEQQMVIEMMNRLRAHLQDKSIPISTYAEIREESLAHKKQMQ